MVKSGRLASDGRAATNAQERRDTLHGWWWWLIEPALERRLVFLYATQHRLRLFVLPKGEHFYLWMKASYGSCRQSRPKCCVQMRYYSKYGAPYHNLHSCSALWQPPFYRCIAARRNERIGRRAGRSLRKSWQVNRPEQVQKERYLGTVGDESSQNGDGGYHKTCLPAGSS